MCNFTNQERIGPPGNREISQWVPASGSLSAPDSLFNMDVVIFRWIMTSKIGTKIGHQMRLLGSKYAKMRLRPPMRAYTAFQTP